MSLREKIDARHEALVLGALDFQPACGMPECWDGRPAATHLAVLTCACLPIPVCEGCATALALLIREQVPSGEFQCYGCKQEIPPYLADWLRIEPLP